MDFYNETHYLTLPGSPKWNEINYDNNDFQPDYRFHLEKIALIKKKINNLLKTVPYNNKTYLEYYVSNKRSCL